MNSSFKIAYGRESRKYAYSLEVQERKILDYAHKNGDNIKRIYTERKSAFKNGQRTEFIKAMKELQNPNCTGIYFAKVDRSLRNLKDMMQLESFIGEKQITFINGEFNLGTAQGRKSFRDACINACHYSEDLSEKIVDSQIEMLEDGYYPYTMPKYLDRADGMIKKNINTPIAKRVFEIYATGLYSDLSLAKRMNELGYTKPNGKSFSKKNISQILTNPLFTGVYTSKEGKTYELNSEPIIPRDFWEQIQYLRSNRDRRSGEKNTYVYSQLIEYKKNKFLCGETVKGISYYKSVRTPEFFYTSPQGKKIRQVREEHIDIAICNHLKNLNISDSFYENLKELYSLWGKNNAEESKRRREEINSKLSNIENKIIQAPLDHMEGKFSADVLERILKRLDNDEKQLKKALSKMKNLDNNFLKITDGFLKLIEFTKSSFETLNPEMRRFVFELLFERSYVSDGVLYFKHTPYLEGLIGLSKKQVFELKEASDIETSQDFDIKSYFWRREGITDRTFEENSLIELTDEIHRKFHEYNVSFKLEFFATLLKKSKI